MIGQLQMRINRLASTENCGKYFCLVLSTSDVAAWLRGNTSLSTFVKVRRSPVGKQASPTPQHSARPGLTGSNHDPTKGFAHTHASSPPKRHSPYCVAQLTSDPDQTNQPLRYTQMPAEIVRGD